MMLISLLIPFCIWHVLMVARNETTIDGSRHPQYNLGWWTNMKQARANALGDGEAWERVWCGDRYVAQAAPLWSLSLHPAAGCCSPPTLRTISRRRVFDGCLCAAH
eukprot:5200080-Prymnesium_polylepis.2